jgi:methylisocitrate lyase
MNPSQSPGARLRQAVTEEQPLQVVGAINAYHAMMAERVGYRALYLSGGGVAAGSLGLPDLGISNLHDVCEDVRRITDVTQACPCWWMSTPAWAPAPSTSSAPCGN